MIILEYLKAFGPSGYVLPGKGPIRFIGSGTGTFADGGGTYNFSSLLNDSEEAPEILEGDMVIVSTVVNTNDNNLSESLCKPSGYVSAHTKLDRNESSHNHNFLVSYKFMGEVPDTSFTMPSATATDATAEFAFTVFVFRGVHGTDVVDAVTQTAGGIDSGAVNPPAITPNTDGAWVFATGAATRHTSISTLARPFGPFTGLSPRRRHFRSVQNSSSLPCSVGSAFRKRWKSSHGAVDIGTFEGSNVTDMAWSAVTMALKPAPYTYADPAATSLSFVGSQTVSNSGAFTRNFSAFIDSAGNPPTVQEGDIVIVINAGGSSGDDSRAGQMPTDPGYIPMFSDVRFNDTVDANHLVSYKVMGPVPDTSVSMGAQENSGQRAVVIQILRGVDEDWPVDDAVATGSTGSGIPNAPAANVVSSGAWALISGVHAHSSDGVSLTAPAEVDGPTNSFRSVNSPAATFNSRCAAGYDTTLTAGSYNPSAFGGGHATNDSWAASTCIFKPYP